MYPKPRQKSGYPLSRYIPRKLPSICLSYEGPCLHKASQCKAFSSAWWSRSRKIELLEYVQKRRHLSSKETRNCNVLLPIRSSFVSFGFNSGSGHNS